RRKLPVTVCKPGQNNPWCTIRRSTSFLAAAVRTRVETSTAAPIFVTRPEFSICRPLSAFGQSSMPRMRRYSFVCSTISESVGILIIVTPIAFVFGVLAAIASAGFGIGLLVFYWIGVMIHAWAIEDRVTPTPDEGEQY